MDARAPRQVGPPPASCFEHFPDAARYLDGVQRRARRVVVIVHGSPLPPSILDTCPRVMHPVFLPRFQGEALASRMDVRPEASDDHRAEMRCASSRSSARRAGVRWQRRQSVRPSLRQLLAFSATMGGAADEGSTMVSRTT
ncbi:hypothetical protein A7982_12821 [Minicystis rosea]|nr:hypothetical protein A7982_12821 [Minicystis rosea]